MRLLLGSGGFRTPERVQSLAETMRSFFGGVKRLLFVPYALRIWLYSTPILYTAQEATDRGLGFLMWLNPMAPLIRAWSSVIDDQELPDASVLAAGAGWAVLFFVAGILYFVSRERELAVRI